MTIQFGQRSDLGFVCSFPRGPIHFPFERRFCKRDRRTRQVYLTNAGKRFISETKERSNVLRNEMLKGVNEKELEITLRVCARIIENTANLKRT